VNKSLKQLSLTRWCDVQRERALEMRHIRPLPMPGEKRTPRSFEDTPDSPHLVIPQVFNA
jgi:hypothetical protein